MKRLLPVLVIFVVLLALVAAKEIRRASVDDGTSAQDLVPLAVEGYAPKDAAKVEVTAPGATEPAFVLEREGEKWLQTKPFRAPAKTETVDGLLEALSSKDAELRADDAESLRDLDLVAERAVQVRVTDATGRALAHVAVGRTTGTQGAFLRFLTDAGDTRAFAATADLRGLLGLPRTYSGTTEPEAPKRSHFLARELPAAQLEKPKRVEVVAPGRRVVFEKTGDAWAAVEGGPGLPVNQRGIEQILEHVGPEFHAKDLADPASAAELGLTEPKWTVTITTEDGKTTRLLGAADRAKDRYHLRVEPKADVDVIYEASSWEWSRLFPDGSALFTFEAVAVPEDTLTRVVVDRGSERIEMTREGTKPADDWKLVSPDWPLVARQSSLRSLSSVVRNVKPVDWVDQTDLGATEVTVRAGDRAKPDAELTTIRVGGKAPSGKDRLAVLPGREGKVFVLADSTVDRIAVSATSLFEAKVLHGWTEADVTAVRVRGAGGAGPAPFSVERADAGWTLVRGEDRRPAADAEVKKWLDALLALETREPAAGDAPEASVTVVKKDGTERTFGLSAAKDGRRTVTVGTLSFPTDRADLLPAADSLVSK